MSALSLPCCILAFLMQDWQLEKCRKLIEVAEASLRKGIDYYYAIEACNEVLDGYGQDIGPALRHRCLCIRAALLLKVFFNS